MLWYGKKRDDGVDPGWLPADDVSQQGERGQPAHLSSQAVIQLLQERLETHTHTHSLLLPLAPGVSLNQMPVHFSLLCETKSLHKMQTRFQAQCIIFMVKHTRVYDPPGRNNPPILINLGSLV